jgi:hypothetical protein
VFPPPEAKFISNPTAVTFYEELGALVGTDTAFGTAESVHDASPLVIWN